MKYFLIFIMLTSLLVFYAFNDHQWFLFYPALSFGLVSFAYLTNSVRIFGKRKDGKIGIISKIVLFPYLVYAWLIWHVVDILRREQTYDRLTPDLFIGRRTRDVPDNVRSVVDLTCEFEEYDNLVKEKSYFSFPILDACPPHKIDFKEVLDTIAGLPKPIYIHCAEGHGRTGTVAAGLLLYEQNAKTTDEAINLIYSVRPKAKLGKSQYEYLQGVHFF